MTSKILSLEEIMSQTAIFLKEVEIARQSRNLRSIEEGIIPILRDLSFAAEEASESDPEIQEKFLGQAYALNALCIEVDHPNTLKEDSSFKRIQNSFPVFPYPSSTDDPIFDRELAL